MDRDIPRFPLLGTLISATDYEEASDAIVSAARKGRALRVSCLDVHGLARSAKNPDFQAIVNGFDLVTPDGHSLRWGLNTIHQSRLKDRVAGPDLTLHVCRKCEENGIPVFAYGSHEHVVRAFADSLRRRFPNLLIAGTRPSRFRPATIEEDEGDIRAIVESGARVVFVGLGCPLQELWIHEHADRLRMPCMAIGAAFDFHSGNKPRAPVWMQNSGLEWLFRLASEPRRLIRRTCPAMAYVAFALPSQYLRERGRRK
jgi:N-acetylglucosaminyldiphosphoundecaprenol N-acetyl-beta-D-mannosaminyltransferase